MKITLLVFVTYVQEILSTIGTPDHVHFKIHVPEIVRQHIHTRIVYVRDLDPVMYKEPPKYHNSGYHEESHSEDWSSWNNYGHDGGQHRLKNQGYYDDRNMNPNSQMVEGALPNDGHGNGVTGYANPPQYDDLPHNNIETFMEDSYRHGFQTESGQYVAKNEDDFYDTNHEEADLTEHDYYHDEHDSHAIRTNKHYDKEIGYGDRLSKRANHKKRHMRILK